LSPTEAIQAALKDRPTKARPYHQVRFRGLPRYHPLVILRGEFDSAPGIPDEVRRQVKALFWNIKNPRAMSEDEARSLANRLLADIFRLRAQHELMRMSPGDRRFYVLSRAVTLWLQLGDKMRRQRRIPGRNGALRMPVVAAASSQASTNDDPNDDGDEEVA
jgi:hypothetical protein